jgi:murein DD-endopeptidase MepM/ murein hydrolase activator NlpD
MHKGIDFAAPTGTPIFAAGDGTITYLGGLGSYGKYVRINHGNNLSTAYAHLSRYGQGVRKGSQVNQGDIIGYVGATGRATGPHLHYEILKNQQQINPLSVETVSSNTLQQLDKGIFLGFTRQIQYFMKHAKF